MPLGTDGVGDGRVAGGTDGPGGMDGPEGRVPDGTDGPPDGRVPLGTDGAAARSAGSRPPFVCTAVSDSGVAARASLGTNTSTANENERRSPG